MLERGRKLEKMGGEMFSTTRQQSTSGVGKMRRGGSGENTRDGAIGGEKGNLTRKRKGLESKTEVRAKG